MLTAQISAEDRVFEQDNVRDFFITHNLNYNVFEAFYCDFCIFKEKDISIMRANRKSFAEGVKKWYRGKENTFLANLIFDYISNNTSNYLMKFSEFLNFCILFNQSEGLRNKIVFHLMTNKQFKMKSSDLMRFFV